MTMSVPEDANKSKAPTPVAGSYQRKIPELNKARQAALKKKILTPHQEHVAHVQHVQHLKNTGQK
jgi:hypothetical protein